MGLGVGAALPLPPAPPVVVGVVEVVEERLAQEDTEGLLLAEAVGATALGVGRALPLPPAPPQAAVRLAARCRLPVALPHSEGVGVREAVREGRGEREGVPLPLPPPPPRPPQALTVEDSEACGVGLVLVRGEPLALTLAVSRARPGEPLGEVEPDRVTEGQVVPLPPPPKVAETLLQRVALGVWEAVWQGLIERVRGALGVGRGALGEGLGLALPVQGARTVGVAAGLPVAPPGRLGGEGEGDTEPVPPAPVPDTLRVTLG